MANILHTIGQYNPHSGSFYVNNNIERILTPSDPLLAGREGGGGEQASSYQSTTSSASAPLSFSRTRSMAQVAAAPTWPPGSDARVTPHNVRRCLHRTAARAVYLRSLHLPAPRSELQKFYDITLNTTGALENLGINLINDSP
eukprot:6179652-Pleurochrysis_carterae.AAC.2